MEPRPAPRIPRRHDIERMHWIWVWCGLGIAFWGAMYALVHWLAGP